MLTIGFMLFLFFASSCNYQVEQSILNAVPENLITPILAGVISIQFGNNLVSHFVPNLAGISLKPCIVVFMVLGLVTYAASSRFRGKANG